MACFEHIHPPVNSSQILCGDIKANFYSPNILRCISYWNGVWSFRHKEKAISFLEDKDCQCRVHFLSNFSCMLGYDLAWSFTRHAHAIIAVVKSSVQVFNFYLEDSVSLWSSTTSYILPASSSVVFPKPLEGKLCPPLYC